MNFLKQNFIKIEIYIYAYKHTPFRIFKVNPLMQPLFNQERALLTL